MSPATWPDIHQDQEKHSAMWKMILTYLYLRKQDPNDPKHLDVRFMHGMNRISIFLFLLALVLMLVRWISG